MPMLKSTRTANRAGAVLQWLRRGDNALRAAVIAAYILMVLLDVITSSIGMAHLRQGPEDPLGTQWGLSN